MRGRQRRLKLRRMRESREIRTLDLFAGCGGLSLGFSSEGFNIIGAVEFDPLAAQSHAINFFGMNDESTREIHGRARDITKTDPANLVQEFHLGSSPAASVDVIIAGPPCQAFARVGRAKLREVAEHPEAFRRDPRADLYLRFLEYVAWFNPVAVLMENVPDVLNFGGHNVAEETSELLGELGYECRYTLLNSAYYGVPQMRERMFLVAVAAEARAPFRFPEPTHFVDLPVGYRGTRQVALRTLRSDLFKGVPYYVPAPEPTRELPAAVTAEEALRDLPPITAHLNGEMRRGARRFTQLAPYSKSSKPSEYGHLMRSWPGFECSHGVYDHVIRSLPRDYAIFRRMRPGDQYPEAFAHAHALLDRKVASLRRNGARIAKGSPAYERLVRATVPPYDPSKFPNKWRKMEPDRPSRTLMAHLGKDSYSHIHYDSRQARTISVREAARLQSFPDGFRFCGTMNPAFRQIGNAVPPLLAAAIARSVRAALIEE